MSNPFDEACTILDEFEGKIATLRAIWKRLEKDNHDFEQVSSANWQEKYYRLWLHGATEVYECHELERWLHDYPPITKTARSPARAIYKAWRKWLKIAGRSEPFMVPNYDKKTRTYVEVESNEPIESFYIKDDLAPFSSPVLVRGSC